MNRRTHVFEATAVALVVVDLSPAYDLARGQATGASAPTAVPDASQIEVIDANRAALTLFEVTALDQLADQLWPLLLPLTRELAAAADGRGAARDHVETELRLELRERTAIVVASARPPSSRAGWHDVVVGFFDATAHRAVEARVHAAERMEAVGRLAASVAHDFNNLMTVIGAAAEFIRDGLADDDPKAHDVAVVQQTLAQGASLTSQLLAFSRKRPRRAEVVDLTAVVARAIPSVQRLAGEGIDVDVALGHGLDPVRLDPPRVEQLLMNLCTNARDAMPHGGTMRIRTDNVTIAPGAGPEEPRLPPGRYVRLEVTDDGVGMDAATRARIFEPFFTSKPPGLGTGLGLATVHGIVAQAGGHIRVRTAPGHGASFRVYLPRAEGTTTATPTSPGAPDPATPPVGSGTIVVVDDDDAMRTVIRRLLERGGYHVLDAGSGEDALTVMAAHDGPVHLLLTDVLMPGMGGRELAERVLATHADTRILFISGQSDEILAAEHQGTGWEFLEKPFTGPALLARVAEALDPDHPD